MFEPGPDPNMALADSPQLCKSIVVMNPTMSNTKTKNPKFYLSNILDWYLLILPPPFDWLIACFDELEFQSQSILENPETFFSLTTTPTTSPLLPFQSLRPNENGVSITRILRID